MTASYPDKDEHVLNEVSCKIKAGTKMAIVGRYGAGKTTLVNALVRLLEVQNGQILIDGIDIAKVQMEVLRSHITMIS